MPLTGLEIAGIAATFLSSTGAAIGFFFKYGVRLALVEKTANDASAESKQNVKDIAATTSRVNTLESVVTDIRNSLSTLQVIPEIKAIVNALKDQVLDVKEQLGEVRGHLTAKG